jgi:ATP-dependent DNA helicase RecG
MRGPLILLVYKLIDAINTDLPKGFLLEGNSLQATSVGLPINALREAIVNALMHRSYRVNRPTQIIRYDNRIEIINPGYSLKSTELLGTPGSQTRNPFIAAVFHDTNLAETKGSGIRAMCRLMKDAHLVVPTFESSRENNTFTSRMLLIHFLNKKDLLWLNSFSSLDLNDAQKQTLVFVRECGAIDNITYRQMADCDTIKASRDLTVMKRHDLLISKGNGKSTYYVPGKQLLKNLNTPPNELNTPPNELNTPPNELNTPPQNNLPDDIQQLIKSLKQKERDTSKIEHVIVEICKLKPFKSSEIASFINRKEDYVKRNFLSKMIKRGLLVYSHPEMLNHPDQRYMTKKD